MFYKDGLFGPWILENPERFIGKNNVGNGECVALAQIPLKMPLTSTWREGAKVLGNSNIKKGTVIATFIEGRYKSLPHGNHVAIYISQSEDAIRVIDQWSGRKPNYRDILIKEGVSDRSNNANAFSIVLTTTR